MFVGPEGSAQSTASGKLCLIICISIFETKPRPSKQMYTHTNNISFLETLGLSFIIIIIILFF